jgi:hypothetical protein
MVVDVPREILYFTEYIVYHEDGLQSSPYIENNKWYIPGISDPVPLTTIGTMCRLDEQELNYLKLKYGG